MKQLFLILLFVICILTLIRCNRGAPELAQAKTRLRIGWQTSWATQGQLAVILQKTDLLTHEGLIADFRGFAYGAPLNEAAVAGQVDVLFTADQPAVMLLAKDPKWLIIGRLMYNRIGLYVPPASPVNSVSDLRGCNVGMPYGAAAQRLALEAQIGAGLTPSIDVTNRNIGIFEQIELVRSTTGTKWGPFDAFAGFDPTIAVLQEKNLIRILREESVVSVIVMSRGILVGNPAAAERFLRAFKGAYERYRDDPALANRYYIQESKMDFSHKALNVSASCEPNLRDNAAIRITLSETDISSIQHAADFLFAQKLIASPLKVSDFIDQTLAKKVQNSANP